MAFGATHLSLAFCLMALLALSKSDFGEKIDPINNILDQNSDMLSQEFCIIVAVGSVVAEAIARERRMGASLIRLFFHDCFVDGCDGGVLLDDIPGRFLGEKTSPPNNNSVRGFQVIDQAKQRIKTMCPGAAVSCADILALAARDSVALLGGIPYPVRLGRRDARTANFTGALTQLPAPFEDLNVQLRKFSAKGFSARELVTLVGAHTVGFARCVILCDDRNINPAMKPTLNCRCPVSSTNTDLVPLDFVTPNIFDRFYYDNLIRNKGLLFSDQVLMGSSATADVVRTFNSNPALFLREFNAAMTKLGDLPPSRGVQLEIRNVCSKLGGIPYPVRLGRRDARTANFTGALTQLPAPFEDLNVQLRKFSAKGFSARELVTLVGAHTVGFARCVILCDDRNINPAMKPTLNCRCPVSSTNTDLVPLDFVTPNIFDRFYYDNLIRNKGLLFSDQVLMGSSATADVVRTFNSNPALFLREFNAAMTKLGDLPPSRGVQLEIRNVCSKVNGNSIADM